MFLIQTGINDEMEPILRSPSRARRRQIARPPALLQQEYGEPIYTPVLRGKE